MKENYIKKELAVGDFKHRRYFTEFELAKDNLLFCDPIFYIDSYYNTEGIDPRYLYNHLLFVFNTILKFFFRAPLRLKPWYRKFIKSAMTEYLLFRCLLVDKRYEKDAEILFKNNPIINQAVLENIDEEGYLKLVADLYHDLDVLRSMIQTEKTECRLSLKDFDGSRQPFNSRNYSTIRFMQRQLKARLDKQVDFFLIHGSYATADFEKNFSDLDTFVVLNRGIFSSLEELRYTQKELQKLSMLCYKINPLAHHTLFIFPDLILDNYLNVFIPIPVLEYSVALKKKNDLIVQQVDGRVEEFNNFWTYPTFFREKVIADSYSKNLFQLECDVGYTLMLPVITFQMIKGPIYKKFSFEKIKEAFPDFDFSLMDEAGEKRKKWKLFNLLRFYPNILFNLLPNILNTYLINKYRFYLLRFKKTADPKEVEDFTKRSLNSFETFFNYCLRNYKK